MPDEILILGCGFTGRRVALLLAAQGHRVTATTRHPARLEDLRQKGVQVIEADFTSADGCRSLASAAPRGSRVLHSVPSLEGGGDRLILGNLAGAAMRVVYLSTTAVYGGAHFVDEGTTVPAPRDFRELSRSATEQAVLDGPWQPLVLRPAAIYGPGRGAHVSLRNTGENFVSRIHVDDLAATASAALFSTLTGAYPVADDCPCTSAEIAAYCANLLGMAVPPPAPGARPSNRRVDGSAIRRLLGITLRYPSYREGVPASLRAVSLKTP